MGRTKCVANSEALTTLKTSGGKGTKAVGVRSSQQSSVTHQKTGFDGRMEAPWRKTVTTFQIPYTLVHTTSKQSKKQPQTGKASVKEREKGRQV
jgi:hypothetical protein